MFDKILIANRGEIAYRVMQSARGMGIKTVAVYSDADAKALHVESADEAVGIGGETAAESYLNIDAILAACQRTGAQAVHPGYGFLSENADFAEALEQADIAFIGPPPEAIRAMGSKAEAKAIMEQARVPLVPGYHGEDQSAERMAEAAGEIGYPVLLKAAAGGGGRGMRACERPDDFQEALESAKREALSAFGDDRMLVEKLVQKPRHVEVQIFADAYGQTVHFFERDCSSQRRHQKVVEEAPAPDLSDDLRDRMGDAACMAAEAIGYVGAGTVEFLLDGEDFYFMEMNTRLQVEHPVTEMITGEDLVALQIRVAAGEPLGRDQGEISRSGHAIEVRLYAEDPTADFRPGAGDVRRFRLPDLNPFGGTVRVEPGVREGDSVSIHYDPMIAKIVAWAEDRDSARQRLAGVLAETQVTGLATNLDFLRALIDHDNFRAGAVDTGFIGREIEALLPASDQVPGDILAAASLAILLDRAAAAKKAAASSVDPHSPWHATDGWRLNDDSHVTLDFLEGDSKRSVTAHFRSSGYLLEIDESAPQEATGEWDEDGALILTLDGHRRRIAVDRDGFRLVLDDGRTSYILVLDDPTSHVMEERGGGELAAPMPGRVVALSVDAGTPVEAGTTLLVLEAMKMEHAIKAPADGQVAEFLYHPGDQVEEGADLILFDAGD
ncbi:MAG: biotin carboxylase N-terminal domain-containing protein [Magnetovibrionaceae bacterium]